MASVYLAHDLKHRRPVAIKVLEPELAPAIGPEQFLREIEITAGFNHPHIVALYAHRRGVVHRDIKPENILLADGQAVAADFGIARAVSAAGGDRHTGPGLVMGTTAYTSPEQTTTERDVDGRSDVYSPGCVLYEMPAGEPPFAGPTPEAIVARRLAGPPLRLWSVKARMNCSSRLFCVRPNARSAGAE